MVNPAGLFCMGNVTNMKFITDFCQFCRKKISSFKKKLSTTFVFTSIPCPALLSASFFSFFPFINRLFRGFLRGISGLVLVFAFWTFWRFLWFFGMVLLLAFYCVFLGGFLSFVYWCCGRWFVCVIFVLIISGL